MLSSRHYLLYQRQNREDEQVKKDVEFNIFDALCQVYDRQRVIFLFIADSSFRFVLSGE